MSRSSGASRVFLLAFGLSTPILATSYRPMSDAELARRAGVIVRARTESWRSEVRDAGGREVPLSIVTLRTLETFKGALPETFELLLPGGRAGAHVMQVEGTPGFEKGEESVLFLDALPGDAPAFRLSEFGLSKFDFAVDDSGRRFAVRRVFSPESDLMLSDREAASAGGSSAHRSLRVARDAASFLAALRELERGRAMPATVRAAPVGGLEHRVRRKWVNLGGREPGIAYYYYHCDDPPCLRRWFVGDPPVAPDVPRVNAIGTQTNLVDDEPSCRTDSFCHVRNALTQWSSVPGVNLGFAGAFDGGSTSPFDHGTVVWLDLARDLHGGSGWDTPAPCGGGGLIAFTATAWQVDPPDPPKHLEFRGDSYMPIAAAEIQVRKVACEQGFRARDFGSILIHEMGHALGLGHSDQDSSMHGTTTRDDWNNAVMFSSRPLSEPLTPQTDDIEGIRYYYATDLAGAPPVPSFTFSPEQPHAGDIVTFTDTSTGFPTAWHWTVGVPFQGGAMIWGREAEVALLSPGVYPVTLLAANAVGSAMASAEVRVESAAGTPCVADARTLCLNGGRFKVFADWATAGDSEWGTGVPLTADSGYFWFFDPNNVEVVVKVLDGCSTPAPSFWVFAAGLTNLQSNLIVTDTTTGSVKLYTNPAGTAYRPVQDTSAFACP